MQLTGAELLVQCLVDRDVDVLFGYPGGAVLDIYDALYDRKELKVIRTSHEQGATHAADGYARSTGKTGVVIATSGPGATNLVTGIATAYMDSVPMVCITGNVSQNLAGRNAFQEVDIASITLSVTKHNFVVRKVEELQETVTRAFAIANSGRKGPVLIDIPKDVLQASVSYDAPAACRVESLEKVDEEDLDRLAELIRKAKKPVIYSGGGVTASESFRELRKLIDRCKIPAVHTIMGIGVLGYEDELNLGMVGMHGRVSSNMAIDECDLLIGVGVRFSDRVALNAKRFAAKAIVVQMDVDPSEIAKNVDVDLSLLGDLKDALNRLVEKLEPMEHRDWRKKIRGFKEEDFVPVKEGLNPYAIIGDIRKAFDEDLFFVTDVGQNQMWTAQYCGRLKPRRFLTSGGLGTMGFSLGAGMGAALAHPEESVVVVTGDGGFHMNLNELATSVRYGLNLTVVVMNNQSLGMVRQWQTLLYDKRYSATHTDLATDYVKLAESFGAKGYRADTRESLIQALLKAKKHGGTTVIEVLVDPDEKVLPMIPPGGTVDDRIME